MQLILVGVPAGMTYEVYKHKKVQPYAVCNIQYWQRRCYAYAIQCLVLTQATLRYALSGTDVGHACYAMSGTEPAYAAVLGWDPPAPRW
eukprot:3501028-Rhodomonas_salina.1